MHEDDVRTILAHRERGEQYTMSKEDRVWFAVFVTFLVVLFLIVGSGMVAQIVLGP